MKGFGESTFYVDLYQCSVSKSAGCISCMILSHVPCQLKKLCNTDRIALDE